MTRSGTTSGPELLVELDRNSRVPLHRQLTDGVREAIRDGRLAAGSRMPSTRVLAHDLGVSRRLVVDAYGQLVAEGFLRSTQGSGTRVTSVEASVAPRPRATRGRVDIDFSPGVPDLAGFPRQAWLKALRQGLSVTESSALGYVEQHGLLRTRIALAEYLARTRALDTDPERIVLCSGVTQGLMLLARCVEGPIAMEEPGFWAHRLMLEHSGARPLPVPVDGSGLDVGALAESGARAVLVTPSHQSPTGVVLSASRRAELSGWAREGRLVIEDDYDADYRYDRAPVGALQGISPDRVAYLGSVSKTLAPGVRIGWMVLPTDLVEPVRTAKIVADNGSSVLDQIAFAEFLESGSYDRHLRQMRKRYAERRRAMLEALSRHLPEATVLGAAAGVQLSLEFPDGYPVDTLIRRASELRVRVDPLARCFADRAAARPGMILGYADVTESQIRTGVELLGRAAHV
ncbi:PLP-dependent aminotransferase family protein [Tsukamurella sp. 8F]|uniref:MocR-like pyridoxine biosynthesis transcription factor PdxR n=1 Tax=unclassified Tsukamurella TaxID=2633480 RepID=UPI0023B930EB|nr:MULTISPECIES: PLP-dependent aminotransferase family protein [unclassified Tsukamurella]MDF0528471.1 PLP-dependent aminotransferase family protein [Tsukamurella sp. 8J]MDF0586297.1 PLP-dependent aminotransferase family protein [Tsukamurella sp. 8F]